jgi:hypothetical protein
MRNLLMMISTLICCCMPAMATPLSPEERATTATEIATSCMSSQAGNPVNQKITVGQIQDYCGCYGKSTSETLTAEDIEKNDESVLNVIAAAATKKCAAAMSKK